MSAFSPKLESYLIRGVNFQFEQQSKVEEGSSKGSIFVLESLNVEECEIDILSQPTPTMIALH